MMKFLLCHLLKSISNVCQQISSSVVVNGGSPIIMPRSISQYRSRADSIISAVSERRKSQPLHIQLLENLVSGFGRDLMLGIFDPSCEFDSRLENNETKTENNNKIQKRWTHTKETAACLDLPKQEGVQFMQELCGGRVFQAEEKSASGAPTFGDRAVESFKGVKDLEERIAEMEIKQSRK